MKFHIAICCLLAVTASSRADESWGKVDIYAPGHASLDYYTYPKYAFDYAVNDPHTGDNKAQWEKRDGDVVKGAYSLVEPDGSLRIVEYYADDHSGFNAVVKRIGPNVHPTLPYAKPVVPIYKAPIPTLSSLGPYVAPIVKSIPIAPVIKSVAPIGLDNWSGEGLDNGYGLSYGLDKGYGVGYGLDNGYGQDYGLDRGLSYGYGLNKGLGLGYAAPIAAPLPIVKAAPLPIYKASLPAYTYNSWVPIKGDGHGYYGYGKAPILAPIDAWGKGPFLGSLDGWGKGPVPLVTSWGKGPIINEPILDGWGKGKNLLY